MTSKWYLPLNTPARTTMRLFCFPYSGGSAQVFREWPKYLPANIQVMGVQYPGRGSRFTEPLIDDMDQMIEQAYREILPFLDRPFALFGHSLGTAICFEVARRLTAEGKKIKYIFPAGRRSPADPKDKGTVHNLPHDDFIKEIKAMGGTPPEILEHAELMELMLPIIRADFKLSETYDYKPGVSLTCPMAVFGSKDDPETEIESLEAWRNYAPECNVHYIEGDHFFLNSATEDMLKIIGDYLTI